MEKSCFLLEISDFNTLNHSINFKSFHVMMSAHKVVHFEDIFLNSNDLVIKFGHLIGLGNVNNLRKDSL